MCKIPPELENLYFVFLILICVFISSNGERHKNEEKFSFSGGRALSSRGQIKRIFFFF